jgi:hypothetical protein
MNPAPAREFGLDWLRVFAFAVLIFYHSGMFFVPWDFHLKNNVIADWLTWPMLFFNRWRLGLLFFISGCGVAFSLRRRSLLQFSSERLRRLFIPLAFGMLVIVPPQIYFERLAQGAAYSSYWDFWNTVFQFQPYPKGSFSWHHLWFVAYIGIFSLTLIPIFGLLRAPSGQRALAALASLFERHPWTIYLIHIPSYCVAITLGPRWPTTHNLISDWANLSASLLTFLWGFVFAAQPRLLDLLERRRREWLTGALFFTALFFLRRAFQWQGPLWDYAPISGYMSLLWIFALTGFSRHHLHRGGPLLAYATQAVYPFYIVHQTIIIAFGFWIRNWDLAVTAKLALMMLVTLIGSWAAFELVRRSALTRLLFGLKV